MSDDEGDSSKKLYEYFINIIKEYIDEALREVQVCEGEALVDRFLKENKQIKILIYWMRKIFAYLVRNKINKISLLIILIIY